MLRQAKAARSCASLSDGERQLNADNAADNASTIVKGGSSVSMLLETLLALHMVMGRFGVGSYLVSTNLLSILAN